MLKTPRILAVIPTLIDNPTKSIESISGQSINVEKIIVSVGSKRLFNELKITKQTKANFILVEPNFEESLGSRVSYAINTALQFFNLRDYDYLLRVDADAVLPKNFIEENAKHNADLTGIFGEAMLIKVSTFMKLLAGQWPNVPTEDTYLEYLFRSKGYKVTDLSLQPVLIRKAGVNYSWRTQFNRGVSMYQLGCEPFHVIIASLDLRKTHLMVLAFIGYIDAAFKKRGKFEFANWVFRNQLCQLISFKILSDHAKRNLFNNS